MGRDHRDYERIEKAIQYLNRHCDRQPSLAEVARSAHLSEFHFQRVFKRWAGISPKRFLQFLTAANAKRLLAESKSVLEATFDTGLSSPGRLHELFVTVEAMSPGEFKSGGEGLQIEYGTHPSPFGLCSVAATQRGICALEFLEEGSEGEFMSRVRQQWPRAVVRENPQAAEKTVRRVFRSQDSLETAGRERLTLHLRGSNFQLQVWQALLKIPAGAVTTYGRIADWLGRPTSSRAVGQAIGANAVGYLIPCHRVIPAGGKVGGYRWGPCRKQAMLARESARQRAS